MDADLKALLISMLSLAPSDRPESVANLVNYPFFTKEENLVAPLTNEWVNKA